MSNRRVYATRITEVRKSGVDTGSCPRCGVTRRTHGGANRTGLCRDCSSGMTPEEREKWRK